MRQNVTRYSRVTVRLQSGNPLVKIRTRYRLAFCQGKGDKPVKKTIARCVWWSVVSELALPVWETICGELLAQAVADRIDRGGFDMEKVGYLVCTHPCGETENVAFVHVRELLALGKE